MTMCDRFETEALLHLEQGLPLDEHFSTCPDCVRARATYERLEQEIATVAEDLRPSTGWQTQVWATVEQRSNRSWYPLRWTAGAAALAATVALVVFVPWRARSPPAPSVQVNIEAQSARTLRGEGAQPGDRLTLAATVGDFTYGELRVYFNDADLLLRCSEEEPPCKVEDGRLEASLPLPWVGSYQSLLILADGPLPELASEGLNADVGKALDAGAQVEFAEEIHVQ